MFNPKCTLKEQAGTRTLRPASLSAASAAHAWARLSARAPPSARAADSGIEWEARRSPPPATRARCAPRAPLTCARAALPRRGQPVVGRPVGDWGWQAGWKVKALAPGSQLTKGFGVQPAAGWTLITVGGAQARGRDIQRGS